MATTEDDVVAGIAPLHEGAEPMMRDADLEPRRLLENPLLQ
jgi:hypothetical protein